jgi:DNA-binding response OmpR family regulator
MANQILWADDEIDQLKPHIIFLKKRNFTVTPVTNGEDVVTLIQQNPYDLIFLDEQMPGMDGLATLNRIKTIRPSLPVVMITKSEEESIMDDAIGGKISDYLIKPVHPKQILMTIKRVLQGKRIRSEKNSQQYLSSFQKLTNKIHPQTTWQEWIDIYQKLTHWKIDLARGDATLRQILDDQYKKAGHLFGRFVEDEYQSWLSLKPARRPPLSVDVMNDYVFPGMKRSQVCFFVIDCMRYDQWLLFERLLSDYYTIDTNFYYSILPTATPYSRNAIFSGLYPLQIKNIYPDLWAQSDEEQTLNQHEESLLANLLERQRMDVRFSYKKVLNPEQGNQVLVHLSDYLQTPLSAFVFNFVDTLVHTRSDSGILQEIAPNEQAFRSLTKAWFEHSPLFQMLKRLAEEQITVVLTTDHGAVHALSDTKVMGDRHTSTSLRYKFGHNLQAEQPKAALVIKHPEDYKLPATSSINSFLIAKEDYYFVYPTNYHRYKNRYSDTFLHGGISMEEMILPIVTLKPR